MPNTITEQNGVVSVIASHTLISRGRAEAIANAIGGAAVILKSHAPADVHYDDAESAGQWQVIDENGTVVADAWTLAAMQDGDPNGHWVTIAEGGASGPAWVSNDPTKAPEAATVTNVDLSQMASAGVQSDRAFVMNTLAILLATAREILALNKDILAQTNKGK